MNNIELQLDFYRRFSDAASYLTIAKSGLPLTLLGIAAINVGKLFGLRIFQRLDGEKLRKIVYVFIGISGLMNVVQHFL